MNNKVSPEYLELLKKSRRELEKALATNQFIEKNLAIMFQITADDDLNLDSGEIIRKEKPTQRKPRKT